jgi:uncharacterized protein YecA (UPF0149 family)
MEKRVKELTSSRLKRLTKEFERLQGAGEIDDEKKEIVKNKIKKEKEILRLKRRIVRVKSEI